MLVDWLLNEIHKYTNGLVPLMLLLVVLQLVNLDYE